MTLTGTRLRAAGSTARDGRAHGLDIVREVATELAIGGDALTGWKVGARLDGQGRLRAARVT